MTVAAVVEHVLPAIAFLAVFVAGLFARSIWDHEHDLARRVRLGTEITQANRLGVTRPIEAASGWPVRDAATIRRELDLLNEHLADAVTRVA